MVWLYLALAIVAEVIGTTALKASNGFNEMLATNICVVSYGIAFYLLSVVVKTVPVGVAYAIWSGSGVVLIAAVGALWFKQMPDLPAILGMALIIAGVLVINLFSKTVSH